MTKSVGSTRRSIFRKSFASSAWEKPSASRGRTEIALLETSPSDSVHAGQSPNRSSVIKKRPGKPTWVAHGLLGRLSFVRVGFSGTKQSTRHTCSRLMYCDLVWRIWLRRSRAAKRKPLARDVVPCDCLAMSEERSYLVVGRVPKIEGINGRKRKSSLASISRL